MGPWLLTLPSANMPPRELPRGSEAQEASLPKVSANGLSLHYEEYGRGFPLLLTHGYAANSHMWEPQVEALSAKYRLILWDMRGHGETDSPEDPSQYSEALIVADMRCLLEHLGVRQAVLGGHSMGGYMTLAFCLTHPDMVRGLVLFATGPGYRNPEGRGRWNQAAHARAHRLDAEGLEALGSGAELRLSAPYHRSARGLAHAARGMLAQFDSRVIDGVPGIATPTLAIVGERDDVFRVPTEYLASRIPGARMVVLEGAGHAANVHRPEAFNGAVLEFLDGLGLPNV